MNTEKHKKALEKEKERIEKELSTIGRRTATPGDWEATPEKMDISRADINEVADEAEEYQTRIALDATFEARLAEVRAALDRIAEGTYGTCMICKNPIEEERLVANPAATTCKTHINA